MGSEPATAEHPDGLEPAPVHALVVEDVEVERMIRAMERLGDRVDAGLGTLGTRLDGAVESLREEARTDRKALIAVILVALLILGAALGVASQWGPLHIGPAMPSAIAAPLHPAPAPEDMIDGQ